MPSLRIQLSALAAAVLGAAAVQAAPSHGGVAAVSSASQTGSGEGDVKIGIMDTISTAVDTASLREGLVLLSNPLEKDFRISWRDIVTPDAAQEVLHQKPDFLMLPTEQIDLMEEQGVQTFRIATRKPWTATDAAHAVGSLVVTRADRTDINTLEDLAGRHIAADTPTSLTGWLALQGEIARAGHDPEKFFGRTTFLSFAYPGVLSAVLHGSADAAVLPTCLLELLDSRGLVNAADLKAIGVKKSDAIVCRHSTALYPDISLVAFPWTPEPLVNRMTVSLLTNGGDANYEWSAMVGTSDLRELYRLLEIGPYRHLRDMSPMAVYKRWQTEIHVGLLVPLLLILNEFRLRGLVAKRTSELSDALSALEASQAEAAVVRDQLGALERKNIAAQMSGMIAHEINAPVGAIRTWAALARIKCPTAAVADPAAAETLSNALSRIDGEATRIADIVSRVRKYARREHERVAICELDAIVESAVRAYRAEERSDARVPINVAVAERQAGVFGQPLELEVLVLNLVRNAASAVRRLDCLKGPEVAVGVELVRVADGRWRITVENPGPVLSAQVFEKLNARAEGLACEVLDGEADREISEGLGLGLTICRGIADSHGATLRFEARPEGGVRATVEIDAAGPAGEDTEGRKTMKVNEQGEDA